MDHRYDCVPKKGRIDSLDLSLCVPTVHISAELFRSCDWTVDQASTVIMTENSKTLRYAQDLVLYFVKTISQNPKKWLEKAVIEQY